MLARRPALLPITLLALVLALLLGAAAAHPAVAPAATFVVNDPGDAGDDDLSDGGCATSEDVCTLRAAIQQANKADDRDTIHFDLEPEDVIAPETKGLDTIRKPLTIDGTGGDGRPGVEISGDRLPEPRAQDGEGWFAVPPHGLYVAQTEDVLIRGLIVNRTSGAGIAVRASADVRIENTWVGLDRTGTKDAGYYNTTNIDPVGIMVDGASERTTIGGPLAGQRNVISGTERGIAVVEGAERTSIEGNLIGLSADGREPIRNDRDAIDVEQGLVGGPPRETEIINNVVSSSGRPSLPDLKGNATGIRLRGAVDTTVTGNWVGYDASHQHVAGSAGAEAATLGIDGDGIHAADVLRATIGGRGAAANHVAGSAGDAILVTGDRAEDVSVLGNVVGLDAEGRDTADEELEDTTNAGSGIRVAVDGPATGVVVGGDALGEGNTVAGSREEWGIMLQGSLTRPKVLGNTVGTSVLEPYAIPDKRGGILLERYGAGQPREAVIMGNRVVAEPVGIRLEHAEFPRVRGNRLGLLADGTVVPNSFGVGVVDATAAQIGGTEPEDANTIVGSRSAGVAVSGGGAAQTKILNNDIGRLPAPGSATAAELGNDIGIAVSAIPGRAAPSAIEIGGATPATANRIANGRIGIAIRGDVPQTTIAGNVIGLDGTQPAGPFDSGIDVTRGPGTQIGTAGRPNVVVDAGDEAIRIRGVASGRRIEGNRLGLVPAPGTRVIGNGNGITLDGASDVVVGYALDETPEPGCGPRCNEIAGSDGTGVAVLGEGVHNTIRGNRIRDTGALAIDLGTTAPDNSDVLDRLDGDGGANRGLNRPAAIQVVEHNLDGTWQLTGQVESAAPKDLEIDVYRQTLPSHADDVGDGATYVATVRPSSRGAFMMRLLDDEVGPDVFYTAVANDADGNTSEFGMACGGLDPSLAGDTDHDAVCDEWERHGLDFDDDGDKDFLFPGAQAGRRDAWLEVDAMDARNVRPSRSSLTRVQEAFAAAPDGGIALHYVSGGGHGDLADEDVPRASKPLVVNERAPGDHDDYDDYRWGPEGGNVCAGSYGSARERDNRDGDCWSRMAARGVAVRYALEVDALAPVMKDGKELAVVGLAAWGRGFAEATGGYSDGEAWADAYGRKGCATYATCREISRSWTFMHELGHSLGLRHSGQEDEPAYDAAHMSVMSYIYAYASLGLPLDFSHGDGPTVIDEQHLDETRGVVFGASAAARGWKAAVSTYMDPLYPDKPEQLECVERLLDSGTPVDFDGDATLEADVAHSVNHHARGKDDCRVAANQTDVMRGDWDEWERLDLSIPLVDRDWWPYDLRGVVAAESVDPVREPPHVDLDGDGVLEGDVCPTVADRDQADADRDGVGDACAKAEVIGATDLAVTVAGPARLRAGEPGTLKLTLSNDWPLAAGAATVRLTLPAGVVLDGTPEGDGTWDAGASRWTVDGVGVRGERTLTVPVRAEVGDAHLGAHEAVAEVVSAADPDVDSAAGNDLAGEDDWAAHPLELLPGDAAERKLTVADAATGEGTKVARRLRFVVTLDEASVATVRLRARTAPGSATAPDDFEATDVAVRFAPGQTEQVVEVPVQRDPTQEDDEDLTLTLTDVDGAAVARGTARGTIRDDDAPLTGGDLTELTCIGPYSDTKACGIEGPGLRGATRQLLVGGRDLYVSDGEQLLQLRRDPDTEAIAPVRCWAMYIKDRGCQRFELPPPEGETDGRGMYYATLRVMGASADGRLVAFSAHYDSPSNEDPRVHLLRRDPETGELRWTGCVAPKGSVGCLNAPVGRPDAVHVAPDGRQVYLVRGGDVKRVDVDAGGVPTAITHDALGEDESDDHSTSALAPDGRTLLLRTPDHLTVVDRDPASGALSVARSVDLPGAGPVAIAPDGAHAFASADGRRLVREYDYPALTPRGCAQERGATPDAGCAARPAVLDHVGELAATADNRDLYASVPGGGAIVLHRDGDGGLKGGRCFDPEDAVGSCGEPGGGQGRSGSDVLPSPDGHVVLTLDGGVVHQMLRVQPPAPDGNRPPVCAPTTVRGRPGTAMAVPLRCADFDGDPVTVRLTRQPEHGVFGPIDPDSSTAIYRPEGGYRGGDAAAFRGNDGKADSVETRVDLSIGNEAPTCGSTSTFAHSTRGPTWLTAICQDPDGDRLTYAVVDGPEHGTLGEVDGPSVRYTPTPGYRGPDRITVRASDPWDSAPPATITIDVGDPAPRCSTVYAMHLGADDAATRDISCTDPDGGPVAVSLVAGVPFAQAGLAGGTLTVRSGRTAGSGNVVLAARDDGGQETRVEVPVSVAIPPPPPSKDDGPSCANDCRPDSGGAITITYLCDGKVVSQAKYAKCRGEAVIIACTSGVCRPTKTAGGAKVRILPGVKGKRLAQVRSEAKPGQRGRLKLQLTKAARRELARKGRLRVALVVDVRGLDGKHTRTRRVITVRAPKRKQATKKAGKGSDERRSPASRKDDRAPAGRP